MSRGTVRMGLHELTASGPASGERLGRSGAGRKRLTERDPELAEALERAQARSGEALGSDDDEASAHSSTRRTS